MNSMFSSSGEHKYYIRQVPLQLLGIVLFDPTVCSWLLEELQGYQPLQQMLFLKQVINILIGDFSSNRSAKFQASNLYTHLEIIIQQVNWYEKGTCGYLIPCLPMRWNSQAIDNSNSLYSGNFSKRIFCDLIWWWNECLDSHVDSSSTCLLAELI